MSSVFAVVVLVELPCLRFTMVHFSEPGLWLGTSLHSPVWCSALPVRTALETEVISSSVRWKTLSSSGCSSTFRWAVTSSMLSALIPPLKGERILRKNISLSSLDRKVRPVSCCRTKTVLLWNAVISRWLWMSALDVLSSLSKVTSSLAPATKTRRMRRDSALVAWSKMKSCSVRSAAFRLHSALVKPRIALA
eukprot:1979451-Rhodomonas_salina.1